MRRHRLKKFADVLDHQRTPQTLEQIFALMEQAAVHLEQGIDQSDADTPEKHAAFLKSELAKWGRVIREAGVKVD